MDYEDLDRLRDIKTEMLELLDDAKCLVAETDEKDRAESYWLAHIRMALDDDHNFLGGSSCTMQDTINDLEQKVE